MAVNAPGSGVDSIVRLAGGITFQAGGYDGQIAYSQSEKTYRVWQDGAWVPFIGGGGNLGGLYLDAKGAADTPDDDFDSTTLDPKWTAVSGSSGTVNLLETSDVSKYDLSTRPGYLLMQVGNNAAQVVRLRQDYTLPDGASIVAALHPAVAMDSTSRTNNEFFHSLYLNDNDTSETSGNWVRILFDVNTTDLRFQSADSAAGTIGSCDALGLPPFIYLRIARSGLTYYFFVSGGGYSWTHMGSSVAGAAYDNIWIAMNNPAAAVDPVPICSWRWIRQGTNDIDPW